ncbi:MAG: lysophospholipid acyltransferase family protein [Chitinispirillales bacterium]|jgi:lysophospholipid acyltransferase (LPLAT)-like uncharacterized protein|nr:lysophospholipid acyltransferase family protein [Chitinispirillales bacterium]
MEKIAPFMIWLIGTMLGKTWRFNVVSPPSVDIFDPKSPPKVYCFWHSSLLIISYLFRNTGKTAIVSQSKDGRIAAGVAARWGHGVVFGSSSRGGAQALRQSVKAVREGRSLGITPDGPKGPREVVKPGAAQIAIVSKAPPVAIRVETKSAWRLRSWDRFLIPFPFAKINIILGGPIELPDVKLQEGAADNSGNSNGGSGNDAVTVLTQLIQENLTP